MRKLLLSILAVSVTLAATAQTVATFEDLPLPKADTFYVNLKTPGKDVGFNDGRAYFPCQYDTSFGPYYFSGFAYSNKTDSVTSGYTNEYSAKTAKGYGGSDNYAVAYAGVPIDIKITGSAAGKGVKGFYITNDTYAYNSMRDGDTYAKKFGGKTGTDPDWFKLTIRGYRSGVLQPDTVIFYLADFRSSDSAKHYIVNNWQWVNLLPLGMADSLQFSLSSSDTGSFGMNTPAYFCMDNFTTNDTATSVSNKFTIADVKVYPNPAVNILYVEQTGNLLQQVNIFDALGRVMDKFEVTDKLLKINIAAYPAGSYLLQLAGNGKEGTMRFVKQ